VAAQFTQLTVNLGAVREGQVWYLVAEQVESIDLVVDHRLGLVIEAVDKVPHRFAAVPIAVVDGLKVAHGTRTLLVHAAPGPYSFMMDP
jgi:hypothetical protein